MIRVSQQLIQTMQVPDCKVCYARRRSSPRTFGCVRGKYIGYILSAQYFAKNSICRVEKHSKQGRRNEKRARGADFVEGHRQNFNYVKIHTLEFRGSVAFFLCQILTDHILKAVFQLRVFYTYVHARKTLNPFQYYI